MDVKLMQFSHPSNSTISSLLRIKPLFIYNHFHFHPQRWNCHGQYSEKDLVVGVKGGESSIIYDVAAAAYKDIAAADLVFEGQLLSVLPSVVPPSMKMQKGKATGSSESGSDRSLGLCSRCLKEKTFTVLSSFPHSANAKTTGYFLVLVPLIAFCIRFILGALHNSVAEDLKRNASQSVSTRPQSKRTRWRSALQELQDPDAKAIDTDLPTDHDHLTGNEDETKDEDLFRKYTMLESDYAKFLSECGISNYGHWRGGSPK